MKAGMFFAYTVERHIHTDRVIILRLFTNLKYREKYLIYKFGEGGGEREGNVLMPATLTWCKGLCSSWI
jgi:hypothetical protein